LHELGQQRVAVVPWLVLVWQADDHHTRPAVALTSVEKPAASCAAAAAALTFVHLANQAQQLFIHPCTASL